MKYIKIKTIYTIIFLFSFLFAISDNSIILNNQKATKVYSGISKWEYDDTFGLGLSLGYVSKPIVFWFNFPVSDKPHKTVDSIGFGHSFFFNPFSSIFLSANYWKDITEVDVDWRGPTRRISLAFINKFEANKKVEYFGTFSRFHYNTNFNHWDATYIGMSCHVNLNNGFGISPWFGIWKFDRYNAERGIGVSFSYAYMLR